MQKAPVNLFFFLSFTISATCQQVDDRGGSPQNYLGVEGRVIYMNIDTTSQLNELIHRLNSKWDFYSTGKFYWIGYTDDMFSIAARGDTAIPELLQFFKTDANENGRIGVIYTLHLIGINRSVAGRYTEHFVNRQAREALLSLLEDLQYATTIMSLLIRDPWKSDIPRLFELMTNKDQPELLWPLIGALERYKIAGLPLNNQLPDTLSRVAIHLPDSLGKDMEFGDRFECQVKEALRLFPLKNSRIKVEAHLYDRRINCYYSTNLEGEIEMSSFLSAVGLKPGGGTGYLATACSLQYYYKNDVLYFITMQTAREMLIDWWTGLGEEERRRVSLPPTQ